MTDVSTVAVLPLFTFQIVDIILWLAIRWAQLITASDQPQIHVLRWRRLIFPCRPPEECVHAWLLFCRTKKTTECDNYSVDMCIRTLGCDLATNSAGNLSPQGVKLLMCTDNGPNLHRFTSRFAVPGMLSARKTPKCSLPLPIADDRDTCYLPVICQHCHIFASTFFVSLRISVSTSLLSFISWLFPSSFRVLSTYLKKLRA